MHCAFCRQPLGYVHGHAACLHSACPMFGQNQAECCAGDQGNCVPTSTAAAAGPPGVVFGTRGTGPDKTAR
jgi:hypothetical protein